MWKFKVSKFKNAAIKLPKKEECIIDVSCGNLPNIHGNHIKASAAFQVFSTDNAGSSNLGIASIDYKGNFSNLIVRSLQVHSDVVTDFDFSPFNDYLLATCSADGWLKIWKINCSEVNPLEGSSPINNQLVGSMQSSNQKRYETVLWNPVASDIIASSFNTIVQIYNVSRSLSIKDLPDHKDIVQSISWKDDGSQLTTSCQDKKIRIFDPRSNATAQIISSHKNAKDSRVLWLGNRPQILSTGFNQTHQREVNVWDTRNFTSPLLNITIDNSTGILMPFFDQDTGMIFIGGKGDTSLRFYEINDKTPCLVENSVETVEQIKGLALLPKRALNVMNGEVNRIILLAQNSISPISYIVPRKSYRDFHEDLFPNTFNGVPPLTSQQWIDGEIKEKSLISLNSAVNTNGLKLGPSENKSDSDNIIDIAKPCEQNNNIMKENYNTEPSFDTSRFTITPNNSFATLDERNSSANLANLSLSKGGSNSKYRNMTGENMHASLKLDNLRNLSMTVPGESDAFYVNSKFCAYCLSGAGGLVAVLNFNIPGRLPDTGVPYLQNSSQVTDIAWDPFNDQRLAIACDDAKIRLWTIPENGLQENLHDPLFFLKGHTEKIYHIIFHPTASDVLTSSSYDMTIRIWNLQIQQEVIKLVGHTDTIFNFSWNTIGNHLVSVSKDGLMRVYEPRKSELPLKTGSGLEGSRGGRIVWACKNSLLVVTGFSKMSARQITVYNGEDLKLKHKIDIDVSPSILVPHYDQDCSILFVTGRGDSLIRFFEISQNSPYLIALSSEFKPLGLHQALAFLPKNCIDVKVVEIDRCLRLTQNSIEPISFRVPRIKSEYFQNDIFIDTTESWKASMIAEYWFSGQDIPQNKISLRPSDMIPLSQAPMEAPKTQKYQKFHEYQQNFKTEEEMRNDLISALTNKLQFDEQPLPQDLRDGCDPDEWDD